MAGATEPGHGRKGRIPLGGAAEEEGGVFADRRRHRRVSRERKGLPADEDVPLVPALGDDLDRLAVRSQKTDRARTGLRRLDALRHDGVEHLLRRDGLGQARGDGLQPVRPGGSRLGLALHLPAALEELRDEDRDDEEEGNARSLIAVCRNEVVQRRREEEVEAQRREHGRDEPGCETAEVRGQRDRKQVQEARELIARPARERVQRRDRGRREEGRGPAESGR